MSPDDSHALARFLLIGFLRLAGVIVTLVGILIVRGVIPGYAWGGVVVIVVGLIDVFVVPQMLARKWRTPPEPK
ncbi:MAG: hypothetical protein P0Y56_07450 [Candidatus Andeanibacterium colombiense]|uniref:Uncharacterized protein n=1 Tax=Candidatus Andeanibacterium colombiense TaxID=3121345 RepID=A0AAJ5XB12_9SPHN|nr:MAG: hypothetical protein P0Y56_07450 [Sphingomonadaceae bacterium]